MTGPYVVTCLGLALDIKLLHPEGQAASNSLSTEGVQAVAAWVGHPVELAKALHMQQQQTGPVTRSFQRT